MKLLQIIPRLPPTLCGVGDQAHELAREWKRQGVETCFLGADPSWRAASPEFPSEVVAARTGAALQSALARLDERHAFDAVVLQFSGYGFAQRGAPVWLVRGLEAWRRKRPSMPLLTMFHELYAFGGSPTTSAFWLGPVQRWVAVRLARISSHVRSNRASAALWLGSVAPSHAGKTRALPVFSNFGEQVGAPPPSQRPKNLVLFGYQSICAPDYWKALLKLPALLGVEKLIGLGNPVYSAAVSGMTVDERGMLSANNISATLRNTRLGYVHYNTAVIGKSSILAAYAAHGVVPVIAPYDADLSEGLEDGVQVLRAGQMSAPVSDEKLDELSRNILRWYAPHCIRAAAADYLAQLRGAGSPP